MCPQFEKMIEFEPEKLSRDLLKVQLVLAALVTTCPGYLVIYTGTGGLNLQKTEGVYTGFSTKNETSETTVLILNCLFPCIYDFLQLYTSSIFCQIIKYAVKRPHPRQTWERHI